MGAKLDLAEIEIELKHGDRSDPSGSGTRSQPPPGTGILEPETQEIVVKSLNEHLRSQSRMPASAIADHSAIAEVVDRIEAGNNIPCAASSLESSARSSVSTWCQNQAKAVASIASSMTWRHQLRQTE